MATSGSSSVAQRWDTDYEWKVVLLLGLGFGLVGMDRFVIGPLWATIAADLGLDPTLSRPCQHPNNVWSLHGYHECLQRLGRTDEAGIIGQQLALARARADVSIVASCACRLVA